MRKIFCIFLSVLMLVILCSCKDAGLSSANGDNPSAGQSGSPATSSDIPDSVSPSPEASVAPSPVDNAERGEIFKTFLMDNYQALSDAFVGGISGIGFADLDADGGMEMLIFDAGASAAMGVQFFDIIDGKVECVSANLEAVGKAFGGKHMSETAVNANFFDDFRFLEDKSSGKIFCIVESGNGAADFSYTELIRFGCEKGVLTFESLMYKYESYDIDSGNVTGQNFKIAGKSASKDEYEKAYAKFFGGTKDTGYTAQGVFMWESPGYEASREGLAKMADKALTLYKTPADS